MYLIYVDESGDPGLINSPSKYFILSGIVIHELRWQEALDAIIDFRKKLKIDFGFKLRHEIHSSAFMSRMREINHIPKHKRLQILKRTLEFTSSLQYISIINIVVDKQGKPQNYDVFSNAWKYLIQRFNNTILHHNFPGPHNADDRGLIVCDTTDIAKLRGIIRKMRHYNPIANLQNVGYRQIPITNIVEDQVPRDSQHSYFIQLADTSAYFLTQKYKPSGYILNKGGRNYFLKLRPVLCLAASLNHPLGIVEI